jgi:serine/threonine-protein kinase
MANSSDDRNPVERLAEEFLARHRRGEHPPLTEYVDRHPEWAAEIRELFPALVMMERLKPAIADVTGSFIDAGRPQASCVPERLGDFRILREVGRGGMGIVFEAEQESLGRHVALKVLPGHALLNPSHLHRFHREARSAARLHHTNIVPVFGVGEGDGLHYYVMQFITGSGLHEVIHELKRLKAEKPSTTEIGARLSPAHSLEQIARSLLTGHFTAAPTDETHDLDSPNGQPGAAPQAPLATVANPASSILSGSGRNFAKGVARVGLQVAEALNYAHGQGVLHRDIKPSNLLLDVQGTVWITDFGLAKAVADSDNLTNEGDILGTLRYMAPERFRGQSDARSDIYALGLTLYELLTLRPAFDQADRDRLILQVTTEVPPRPCSINSAIPRDLETIVLKAIEHEPARRYQDAAELADDLERFLADLPIKARPVGALERAGKWARRKPVIAGLLGALAMAVVVGFAGITWQWRSAVTARNDAQDSEAKAQANFEHALETVNTFCTEVSEEQLLDQPGMQPLRRRLLELALTYYQRFQREQGNNPRLMRELAGTFLRSGIIIGEVGDSAQSHVDLFHARDILNQLLKANSSDIALRLQLARCHIEIEDSDRFSLFATNTDASLQTGPAPSIPLMLSLVAEDQDNPEYLRVLGRSYSIKGLHLVRNARFSDADDFFNKSIVTLERVRRIDAENVESARWLALAYSDQGHLHEQTGHHLARLRALRTALAILDSLVKEFPKSRRNRFDRAQCLVRIGEASINLGQYQEATTLLREADQILGVLSQEDPEALEVRYWLTVAKRASGRRALAGGQTAAAVALLREAVAIYDRDPGHQITERDLIGLASSHLWLGRAELRMGNRSAIPQISNRLAKALDDFKGKLIYGTTVAEQTLELAAIEGSIEPWLSAAHAETAAARIAAQQQEVRARERRSGRQPENPALAFEVAASVVELAELQEQRDELAEARSSLGRALPTIEKLAKTEPKNLRWQQGLARALEARGRVQARSNEVTQARDTVEHAATIANDLARIDPAYSYDLACTLSLRATLSSSEPDALAAIAALRQAIANGLDNEHLLQTDPRLAGLRSRTDFPSTVR